MGPGLSVVVMNIYLVGFMGCGKSEVGRHVADEIEWAFEDTDEIVEVVEGRTIERVFAESGESRFRQVERQILGKLSERSRVVVATGGGMFLDALLRRQMRRSGAIVWLDVPLERIRERLGAGDGRPLWNHEEPIAMRALYEKRRAAYALADFRVAATAANPTENASRVLERLRPVLR